MHHDQYGSVLRWICVQHGKEKKKNEQQPNWKRYFKNWIAHYARLLLFCRSRNESASVVRIYSRKCQNNGTFRWFGNKTYGALRGSQLNTTEIWWLLVAQQMKQPIHLADIEFRNWKFWTKHNTPIIKYQKLWQMISSDLSFCS